MLQQGPVVPESIHGGEGDREGRQQVREGQVQDQDVPGIVDVTLFRHQYDQHYIQGN